MKKSQQVRLATNEENVFKNSKCPCPVNQHYARKNDRTPLGEIQDLVNKKQYLTVDYEQQGKKRSKSSSFLNVLSPIKHSSGSRQIQAESTRIAPAPSFKPSLTKLPLPIAVRPIQKPEFVKPSHMGAVRARSSSCRCPESKKKLNNDVIDLNNDGSDAVFIQTTSARTAPQPKNLNKPQKINCCQSKEASGKATSLHRARSAENLSHGQILKSTSSDRISASGSTRPSISSRQTQSTLIKTALKTEQSTQDGEDFVPWINPHLLNSRQKLGSTSIKSISKTTQTSQLWQNLAAANRDQCCSSTSSSTTKERDSKRYTTLPSQQFVTLSHDTLKTTIGSESSDLEAITYALSKVKVVRDSSIFAEEETTFVDGQVFFKDFEQGKRSTFKTMPVCSPLTINVPLRRSNSVSEAEPAKRVKTTLRRSSSIKKIIVFPLLYSPQFLEDIILYSYKNRNNFLLKPEWIDAYLDKRYRTATINWILEITELIVPQVGPIYYMAVRIFDYTVIKLKLRKGTYQLAAIIAFWISLKYLDNTVLLKIPKIYALCNGKHSKEQILSMERTILKSINFCLNISDPLDFLHFYLKSSNLENNELLKYGSKFVLECATLFETYSMTGPAFAAASALYLAYRVIANTKNVSIHFMWYETSKVQKYAESVLAVTVKYVIMEKYEPFNKYLTAEKLQVAKKFFNI